MSDVHEIADRICRISRFDPNFAPVEFTQFLLVDETPLLFHTGQKAVVSATWASWATCPWTPRGPASSSRVSHHYERGSMVVATNKPSDQ